MKTSNCTSKDHRDKIKVPDPVVKDLFYNNEHSITIIKNICFHYFSRVTIKVAMSFYPLQRLRGVLSGGGGAGVRDPCLHPNLTTTQPPKSQTQTFWFSLATQTEAQA